MKSRTPRHYRGIENPVKKMADLLPDVVAELGQRAGNQKEEIFRLWFVLIGEQSGPMTEPISWFEGVLTVKVKSFTLYSLLCQHERPLLLKRLQEKFPIRNLVFRVG